MFERFRIIHFVGIGGIGMSGIAEVLHNLGYKVTGSDMRHSETTARLRDQGVPVFIGHDADNVDDAHVVVVSSAVPADNPEVVEARAKAIPVIPRAEMLAELARLKYGVLVAGAHGKTTTTSFLATILAHGGFDPTVVIGGRLKATGSNARLGQGEFLVAEADESDGSFLKLSPTIAVVTNIDREHMDFFRTLGALKEAFLSFVNKVPFYGASVVCIENEHIRDLLPSVHRPYMTYGLSAEAQLYADRISTGFMSTHFEAVYKGTVVGTFEIPIPGIHNVLNSLAAIGAAFILKMNSAVIREALQGFSGIQRRLELKGETAGIRVFDDYGHHPAEIQATLKAVKEGHQAGGYWSGRLFVLFQPHRYTRTRNLMTEFANSFHDADRLIILDIYPAGEQPIDGVNSSLLAEKIREAGCQDVVYTEDRGKAVEQVIQHVRKGDVVLTLGAGDVWKTGEKILHKLQQRGVDYT
jgi:UDP-N-acetylmuramate--alanine ligase